MRVQVYKRVGNRHNILIRPARRSGLRMVAVSGLTMREALENAKEAITAVARSELPPRQPPFPEPGHTG